MSNLNIEIKSEDEVVEIESTRGIGVWTEAIESYFIGLIEDEVKKGNIPTTTLTKPAWKFIKQKLKEKSGKDCSQDQVKNKYNQLRAKWKEFSKIIEETGIGYNAVTHQLTAEDVVWKKLYEVFYYKQALKMEKWVIVKKMVKRVLKPRKPIKPNGNPKKLREKVNIAMADALVAMSENSKKKLELLEKKMSATTSSTSADDGNDIGNHSKENHDLLLECMRELMGIHLQRRQDSYMMIHCGERSSFACQMIGKKF
ncbi:L10-interacting MYB domain-containing protein [Bienertia sinuspersici]